MISVLIADDQALVRGALGALLDLEPDIEVVAEVGRGDEVFEQVERLKPDVALIDIEMPGLDGLGAAAQIIASASNTKVLIVTTFGRPGYVKRALELGVSGFLVKDTPARELAQAIRKINAGERVVDPALATEALLSNNPLTTREIEILQVAESGLTILQISKAVKLSQGTVRNHLSAAIGKTGASTRAQAAHIARQNGWI